MEFAKGVALWVVAFLVVDAVAYAIRKGRK